MGTKSWLKRLIGIIAITGLPFAALTFTILTALFSMNACGSQCSLERFITLFLYTINESWVKCLASGLIFGIFSWIIVEFQNKHLSQREYTATSADKNFGSAVVTGITITHLAQTVPPTRWLAKFDIANPWAVVVDGEHIASFKPLGSITIPLEPGVHEVFVGFENHQAWWKKSSRSMTHRIDIQSGQIHNFTLKWSTWGIVYTQLGPFSALLLLVTESIWLYPLLNMVPDAYWVSHPHLLNIINTLLPFHPISFVLLGIIITTALKKEAHELGGMLLLEAKYKQ